jgi:hypothetical protein
VIGRGTRAAGGAALLALALARTGEAAEPAASPRVRRGPLEIRDEWLLAQPRLSLPAVSPDPLPDGQTRLVLDFSWGNDFGWQPGPLPDTTDFLVDGEQRTFSVDVRHGLTRTLTVGLRLPLCWRGGGLMDGIIDWFHELTGLPGGARADFPVDQLRVEWADPLRRTVSGNTGPGTGLGNLELLGHWAVRHRGADAWAAALVARVALPTATTTFAGTGTEAGAQLVAAWPLHSALDLYAGAGGTAYGDGNVAGVEYAAWRGHGFLALEWRPGRRWSVSVELDLATRLVENLPSYPDWQGYFRMGAFFDLSERWRVHGGFTEGIVNQQATTDFGIVAGLSRRF